MAHKPLSADVVRKIRDLLRDGWTKADIARELKLNRSTVFNYVKQFAPDVERGGPPPEPGKVINKLETDGSVELTTYDKPPSPEELERIAGVDRKLWVPQYYRPNVWQGFYRTQDGHKKVQLVQSRMVFKRILHEGIEQGILDFVKEHVPAKPLLGKGAKPKPLSPCGENGFLVVAGIWDAHIGMYAWRDEVGADYDVDLAGKRIKNVVDDLILELACWPIERVLIPFGNDFLHYDSVRHKTAHGEHFLDTDTRYPRVFQAALSCAVYQIDRFLEICNDITVPWIPGNHDYTSSYCLCAALASWYRNDKRVTVDLGANQRKSYMHGGVLLGFEHGTDCKPEQLARLLATENPEAWGKSTYREVQIGHKHQKREWMFEGVIPTNGVTVRMNPALTNVDQWHHKQGFIGEPMKAVEAWRYDRVAYRGSHCVWARDERALDK